MNINDILNKMYGIIEDEEKEGFKFETDEKEVFKLIIELPKEELSDLTDVCIINTDGLRVWYDDEDDVFTYYGFDLEEITKDRKEMKEYIEDGNIEGITITW